ncbi:MAG TPA: site-2 protease family protein [Candidatus Tumulicola sp.]
MDYLPRDEDEPKPPAPQPQRARGWIGTAGAAALAFFLKFKLLLLVGVKLLAPVWTFALSLWLYVALFGWRLAIVVMFVLLAHELGHYFAFRAYGLPVRLPTFVPLLGAFTAGSAAANLEDDAYISLAGPITGLGLSAACVFLAHQYDPRFWYACADVAAFLNLFNMIPTPPFDGGRIVGAVWPPLWIAGFVLFIGGAFALHFPVFIIAIVGVLGLPSIIATLRGQPDPRSASMTTNARIRVSLWYLGTTLGLFLLMGYAHAGAAASSVTAW